MNRPLTLGSLFDGSGGFPLGGLLSGVQPLWASEVEPFPIRVTTKRLPFMKHYGDVSKINGAEIEPVDIITFGSPCTDMSVAGKRAGLEGQQSVLFYEAIRIVKEMRCATNGKYPRYIVWENVPGAFSSNHGEDFKAVLEAIIDIVAPSTSVPMPEGNRWAYADLFLGNGWSLAYRTLDAQYWGVPQRRRRIYLVADFAGQCAGKVLFESEGLSRYSAESFRSWQRTAGGFTPCACAAGFDGYNGDLTGDVSSTLGVNCGMSTGRNGVVINDQMVYENHSQDTRYVGPLDTAPTVSATYGTGGNNQPFVVGCNWDGKQTAPTLTAHNAGGNQRMPDKEHFNCVLQPFGISSNDSNAMKSDNPRSGIYKAETARTLDANGGNPACNQGGIAVVCVDQGGGKSSCSVSENLAPTLACTHGGEPAVCVKGGTIVIEGNGARPSHRGEGYKESDVMYTLNTVDRHAVYAMTTGNYCQPIKDASPTLLSRDYKDPAIVTEPAYGIGRDAFNQGKNAQFTPTIEREMQPTIVAKGPGAVATPYGFDPSASRDVGQYFLPDCGNTLVNGSCPGYHNGVMETGYAVRRLTPIECARLQGFPDWWCADLETPVPTHEDMMFWTEVFETHRKITDPDKKPKSEAQVRKWIANPYSDAAEYKMWGNGVALPCVFFVLSGIVFYTQNGDE